MTRVPQFASLGVGLWPIVPRGQRGAYQSHFALDWNLKRSNVGSSASDFSNAIGSDLVTLDVSGGLNIFIRKYLENFTLYIVCFGTDL